MSEIEVIEKLERSLENHKLDEDLYASDMVWNKHNLEFSKDFSESDYQVTEFSKNTIKRNWLYSVCHDLEDSWCYILYFDSKFKPVIYDLYQFNGSLFNNMIKAGAKFSEAVVAAAFFRDETIRD